MKSDKKKKVIIGAVIGAAVVIAVIVAILLLNNSKIKASTMRLLRIVGVVTLEDGNKKKTILDNLRLSDGNALSTAAESLASVGLDDTKIISIEENSRAEFYQKGKKLELILTKGRLFFDVQQSLADNESLDIKSSTMVVGIRGTSGYVWEDPATGIQYIYITDGHVTVNGYNPQTGKTEEVTIGPGQRATAYMNDDGTFNTFTIEDVTEDDLPIALIRELFNNPDTLERVLKATGYDKNKLLKRILESDEALYIALDGLVLPELEPETEPESESQPEPEPISETKDEKKDTVSSTDDKSKQDDSTSSATDDTKTSTKSNDNKKTDTPATNTSENTKPATDQSSVEETAAEEPKTEEPAVHVHEWVTETYYTTEIQKKTVTETQYVTVQETIDHPEVSHYETKWYALLPNGTESGPHDSPTEASDALDDFMRQNPNVAGSYATEDRQVKVVDTQAWQETVDKTVPKEVQVTRDYEVQVPHERTYCATCGEEQ